MIYFLAVRAVSGFVLLNITGYPYYLSSDYDPNPKSALHPAKLNTLTAFI